ncbi:exopolysaccharide biosynthesis protein [Agrobacterium vitis]|uniref:exopolysaccharide biosynthesis protein n=1 Tax=Agrobacterium vitis TaxID=373 RepID=UPI0012E8B2DC|nr:exopolysaccharide biosynthesis protein [Agrobacterium vitis]MUZ63834.1 exopolysaccharide biosynthesis protein [Agrobacterium vitis]
MDQKVGGDAEQTAALPLSQILFRIAEDETRARVSIGDIFEALGDRAFGALILIFALPNIVPTPPGTSAITGAPLVFLAAQLMLGWQPWLPGWITKRSLARADFSAIVARIVPWLARGERLLKPRFGLLVRGPAENLLGIMAFILAIILALPIPLGNILPAIALSLFAFALLEKDGLYALAGSVVFLLSIVVVAGVIVALGKAALLLFSISFG